MAATVKGTTLITVGNLRSGFSGDVPVTLIDDSTSCYKTGYAFTDAFRRRGPGGKRFWDGKIHLYSPLTKSIPTGAVPLAIEALRSNGYNVRLRVAGDAKPLPVTGRWNRVYGGLTPRDYQVEAVEAALKGSQYIGQKGVLRVPTGGGKTLITAMLCEAFGLTTLIFVHGQNLVDQTYDELCRFLGASRVGRVMASEFEPSLFTVMSVDTVAARLARRDPEMRQLLASARAVVADEAHRVGGGKKTFQRALDLCPATARFGLSGTPFKKTQDTDLILMSRTGTLLYDLPPTRLQDVGHLAKADLLIYEVTQPQGMELGWREAMDELVFQHPARTEFIIRKALEHAKTGKSILLIAGNSVGYVKNLQEEWKRQAALVRGTIPRAAFVTGTSGRERVGKAVQDLRDGRISLLCSTVLFDEGTDVPSLDVVILASPSKSFVKVMQRIGRGLRPKVSGGKLLVIDILDSNNPYLIKHFYSRLKTYESEGIFDKRETAPAGLDESLIPVLGGGDLAQATLYGEEDLLDGSIGS